MTRQQEHVAKATEVQKGDIKIRPVEVQKSISASASDVFRAWTDAELVKQWWGPETFTCPYADVDAKIGGKYLFAMRSPQGLEIWSTGIFRELDPGRRVVITDFPANERGDIVSPEEAGLKGPFPDEGAGLISVDIRAVDDGETELRLRHDNLPARMHDECVNGWSSSLDKLKRLVEKH